MATKKLPDPKSFEPPIFILRGRRVVLDVDLARVYGVTTSSFNQAFKRNQKRFPKDFVFQLSAEEFADLRSQFVISNSELPGFSKATLNRSQIATGSEELPDSSKGVLNRSQIVIGS